MYLGIVEFHLVLLGAHWQRTSLPKRDCFSIALITPASATSCQYSNKSRHMKWFVILAVVHHLFSGGCIIGNYQSRSSALCKFEFLSFASYLWLTRSCYTVGWANRHYPRRYSSSCFLKPFESQTGPGWIFFLGVHLDAAQKYHAETNESRWWPLILTNPFRVTPATSIIEASYDFFHVAAPANNILVSLPSVEAKWFKACNHMTQFKQQMTMALLLSIVTVTTAKASTGSTHLTC